METAKNGNLMYPKFKKMSQVPPKPFSVYFSPQLQHNLIYIPRLLMLEEQSVLLSQGLHTQAAALSYIGNK